MVAAVDFVPGWLTEDPCTPIEGYAAPGLCGVTTWCCRGTENPGASTRAGSASAIAAISSRSVDVEPSRREVPERRSVRPAFVYDLGSCRDQPV